MIANSFEEFVVRGVQTIQTFINSTESGKSLATAFEKLWLSQPRNNKIPSLAELDKAKQNFLTFLFFKMIEFDPSVKEEFCGHLYRRFQELQEN